MESLSLRPPKFNIKTKLDGKVRKGFEILKLLEDDVNQFYNIFGISLYNFI